MENTPPPPSSPSSLAPSQHEHAPRTELPGSPRSSHEESPMTPPEVQSSELDAKSTADNAEAERHPRGKRKRTAAKDKVLLEEAYIANPKPDKAARLSIVRRVSLNEKEVQIWFQNRRQNDRRKSRPLSPQEVAALRYGGMHLLSSSDPLPYDPAHTFEAINSSPERPMSIVGIFEPVPGIASPILSQTSATASLTRPDDMGSNASSTGGSQANPTVGELEHASGNGSRTPSPTSEAPLYPHHHSFHSGSLPENVSRASTATPQTVDSRGPPSSAPAMHTQPTLPSSLPSHAAFLPPPSSQIRLRLGLDGKAQLVPSDISPPRPPQPQPPLQRTDPVHHPIRRPSLQRSKSAQAGITLPPLSALTSSLTASFPTLPSQPRPLAGSAAAASMASRLSRNRSRDTLAWQFCCDVEGREDELTAQARNESTGSAVAAISLLRSTSSAGSLQQTANTAQSAKRSAPAGKDAPRINGTKKPKLSRSSISVGRMQSGSSVIRAATPDDRPVTGYFDDAKDDLKDKSRFKVSMLLSPGGNESDKENWTPEKESSSRSATAAQLPPGRRPLSSQASNTSKDINSGRVLGSSNLGSIRPKTSSLMRSQTAPIGQLSSRYRGGNLSSKAVLEVDIFEDADGLAADDDAAVRAGAAEGDEAVQRFMRGEVSPSKKGDMDCVAGLLSLSQGNWR